MIVKKLQESNIIEKKEIDKIDVTIISFLYCLGFIVFTNKKPSKAEIKLKIAVKIPKLMLSLNTRII